MSLAKFSDDPKLFPLFLISTLCKFHLCVLYVLINYGTKDENLPQHFACLVAGGTLKVKERRLF
jgi:hypothetical protein